jgi:hypothetical protein
VYCAWGEGPNFPTTITALCTFFMQEHNRILPSVELATVSLVIYYHLFWHVAIEVNIILWKICRGKCPYLYLWRTRFECRPLWITPRFPSVTPHNSVTSNNSQRPFPDTYILSVHNFFRIDAITYFSSSSVVKEQLIGGSSGGHEGRLLTLHYVSVPAFRGR